jgi:hypothetical protein
MLSPAAAEREKTKEGDKCVPKKSTDSEINFIQRLGFMQTSGASWVAGTVPFLVEARKRNVL